MTDFPGGWVALCMGCMIFGMWLGLPRKTGEAISVLTEIILAMKGSA